METTTHNHGWWPFNRRRYNLQYVYYVPQVNVRGVYRVYYDFQFGSSTIPGYIDISNPDNNDFGVISEKAKEELSKQGKQNVRIYKIEAVSNVSPMSRYVMTGSSY